MIVNLPEKIQPKILQNFDFGNIEANNDDLLRSCFVNSNSIRHFLRNDQDLLIGTKGAGKTAIIKQLMNKEIKFQIEDKRMIFIHINDEPEYQHLLSLVNERMNATGRGESNRFRILWEILIIYRICYHLNTDKNLTVKSADKKIIKEFVDGFYPSDRMNLMSLIKFTKRTYGFKLDYSNPAFPIPEAYLTAEPSPVEKKTPDVTQINLREFKEKINSIIEHNSAHLIVFVDKLDDFVAGDEYDIQKNVLQGVIKTCLDYSIYKNINIKLSIRKDLFNRMNHGLSGGRDKVIPSSRMIYWDLEDSVIFIARRIAHNLVKSLNLKNLVFQINQLEVYRKKHPIKYYWYKYKKKLPKVDSWEKKSNETSYFEISKEIVLTLFPSKVKHVSSEGKESQICIFEYFEKHFCMGCGEIVPRNLILFLNSLKEVAIQYYQNQPDEDAELIITENRYPLFKREFFPEAYKLFQKEIVENMISVVTEPLWKKNFRRIVEKINDKKMFTVHHLNKLLDFSSLEELRDFVSYLTHLGFFKCMDNTKSFEKRSYALPVIFQKINRKTVI